MPTVTGVGLTITVQCPDCGSHPVTINPHRNVDVVHDLEAGRVAVRYRDRYH